MSYRTHRVCLISGWVVQWKCGSLQCPQCSTRISTWQQVGETDKQLCVCVRERERACANVQCALCRDALHRHSAPVWQVSWVIKEHSMGERKAEVLVSTSVDGRILQWSIRKGFESNQLMKLKRMVTPKPLKKTTKSKHGHSHVNTAPAVGQGEAYISQHAPGMGFDFWPKDSNVWVQCSR